MVRSSEAAIAMRAPEAWAASRAAARGVSDEPLGTNSSSEEVGNSYGGAYCTYFKRVVRRVRRVTNRVVKGTGEKAAVKAYKAAIRAGKNANEASDVSDETRKWVLRRAGKVSNKAVTETVDRVADIVADEVSTASLNGVANPHSRLTDTVLDELIVRVFREALNSGLAEAADRGWESVEDAREAANLASFSYEETKKAFQEAKGAIREADDSHALFKEEVLAEAGLVAREARD